MPVRCAASRVSCGWKGGKASGRGSRSSDDHDLAHGTGFFFSPLSPSSPLRDFSTPTVDLTWYSTGRSTISGVPTGDARYFLSFFSFLFLSSSWACSRSPLEERGKRLLLAGIGSESSRSCIPGEGRSFFFFSFFPLLSPYPSLPSEPKTISGIRKMHTRHLPDDRSGGGELFFPPLFSSPVLPLREWLKGCAGRSRILENELISDVPIGHT